MLDIRDPVDMALTFLTQNGTWVTMRSSLVPAPTERTCRSTPWSLQTIVRPRNRRGALRRTRLLILQRQLIIGD